MVSRTRQIILLHLTIIILISACKEKAPQPPQRIPQALQPVNNSAQDKVRTVMVMDKSPMDMIYLPDDYPVLKMSGKTNELPVARAIYSRPMKDNRSIFGNVVKYGSYWRFGANESTEIEFFRDVTIIDTKVKKGRYIIYCIPYKDKWTIRLNNDLYTWGLKVHSQGDLYSFDIPVVTQEKDYDVFTMQFYKTKDGAALMMAWDHVKASLPIRYDK